MRKFYGFCGVVLTAWFCCGAFGATVLKPKKAAPVAQTDASTSTTSVGASMLPTALNLVQGVMQLSQQQKALTAECYPTSSEINFVNNLVKEWANAGGTNPARTSAASGGTTYNTGIACGYNDTYEASVRRKAQDKAGTQRVCWETFKATEARGAVWEGYPKAVVTPLYCPDGSVDCNENKKVKSSNMWDLFAIIDFGDADYTKSEASQAAALRQKVDKCSDAKLLAQKKAAVGGFITGTISNLGQPTNTGSVMEMVTGIMGQKGVGGVGGLANIATTLLDK